MREATVNESKLKEAGYMDFSTTFFNDFSKADTEGAEAIIETFNRFMEEWEAEYKYLTELYIKYLTELSMSVLFKRSQHYITEEKLANTYHELFKRCNKAAESQLETEGLIYYTKWTGEAIDGDYLIYKDAFNLYSLKQLPITMHRALYSLIKDDVNTSQYVGKCVELFFAGEWGVDDEDIKANWREIKEGTGRVVARYKKAEKLEDDIYIIASFDRDNLEDSNASYVSIIYCSDY